MNILFVDDSFEARDFYRLSFRLAGHKCKTANNGLEALRLMAQNVGTFDVIIMDYNMPDMNGLEVVQKLRAMEDFALPPVILFTGIAAGELERDAREVGVARVLYKPIRPFDLTGAAQDVVLQQKILAEA